MVDRHGGKLDCKAPCARVTAVCKPSHASVLCFQKCEPEDEEVPVDSSDAESLHDEVASPDWASDSSED